MEELKARFTALPNLIYEAEIDEISAWKTAQMAADQRRNIEAQQASLIQLKLEEGYRQGLISGRNEGERKRAEARYLDDLQLPDPVPDARREEIEAQAAYQEARAQRRRLEREWQSLAVLLQGASPLEPPSPGGDRYVF